MLRAPSEYSLYTTHRVTHLHEYQSIALDAINEEFGGTARLSKKLRLADLLTKLFMSYLDQCGPKSVTKIRRVASEFDRLLERLLARTKMSEAVTLNSFFKLSSEAQNILGSMLALETRDFVDNFTQIDFNRDRDHNALVVATKRARDWISEERGRPKNDHLDQFFDGVTELFMSIAGADLKVSNHYNKQPKTPFETILHAGHCLIDINVSYHATIKAYKRFTERN